MKYTVVLQDLRENHSPVIKQEISEEQTPLEIKQELKRKSKEEINKKYQIGKTYYTRIKSKCGSESITKEYKLIKYVYTIRNIVTNSLIVKQISGPQGKIYTLTKHDCKILHVKFEPGLQILSMELNLVPKQE